MLKGDYGLLTTGPLTPGLLRRGTKQCLTRWSREIRQFLQLRDLNTIHSCSSCPVASGSLYSSPPGMNWNSFSAGLLRQWRITETMVTNPGFASGQAA